MADNPDAPETFAEVPRANLMPPEMGAAKRQAGARRLMRLAVLVVAIIVVAGVAASFAFSAAAQSSYDEARQQSQSLIVQKAGFNDLVALQEDIALGTAAVKVGGAPDIEWGPYFTALQKSLPSGVTITTIGVDSTTATTAYAQSTVPLEGARVATLTFAADSKTLPDIPKWVDGLRTLPGFVDATPGSITASGDGYTAAVVLHINSGAFSNRFTGSAK